MAGHSEASEVTLTLTTPEGAPPVLLPAAPLHVQEGDDVTLSVPLAPRAGRPTNITWTRGEDPLVGERFSSTTQRGAVTLTVRNASVEDSGHYSLSAYNDSGQSQSDLLLQVRTRPGDVPFFLRRLNDLAVKVGTRTRFLVEIRSPTQVKVSWEQEGKPVLEGERYHLLHEGSFFCVDVAPVTLEDAGLWICRAHNANGTATCFCHLNVLVPKAYKAPHFIEELVAFLTQQGTVSLECKVVGVPTPTLKWFKDNQEIKAGDVFALSANPADAATLGTYTCEAINCMGKAYSTSRVHILSKEGSVQPVNSTIPKGQAPIFSKGLKNDKVKIGGRLTLDCKVKVPPWPKSITWYNKEGVVEMGGRYHIMEDGLGAYSINIDPVETVDDGAWKCVAASDSGVNAITKCFVTISYPKNFKKPKFLESLKAILTEEGLVSFECKVVGYPTPQLTWFKDGHELKPGDVYQLTGTNSLGSYCCIAKNCMGEASSTAELTVEDIQSQLNEEERLQLFSYNQPPSFLHGLKSQEAKISDPLRLTVQVSVSPRPTVSWYRDDEEIQDSDKYKREHETKGACHLIIKKLELIDQAEWKCVATNDYGQSVTSCFIKLAVPSHYKKPRFLEKLRAVLSDEGAVNLECKVIGVPQPTLKWYKDGRELKPGDIHRIISGQDGTCCLGTYTCEATNCMGTVSSSASLLGFEDRAQVKPVEPSRSIPSPVPNLVRQSSLSTIQEERTSQLHDTVTVDERPEVSFSFDGREVSVSLYETPDLTEEEALQVIEMYADELSEHISEHNVIELPPMRFVKETSTSGHILMEAVVIDVSPEYYASAEDRTEADFDELSITEDNGFMSPIVITPEEMPFDKFTAEIQEQTKRQAVHKVIPTKPPRKHANDDKESLIRTIKEAKLSPEEESSENYIDALSSQNETLSKEDIEFLNCLSDKQIITSKKTSEADVDHLEANSVLQKCIKNSSEVKVQPKNSRSRSKSSEELCYEMKSYDNPSLKSNKETNKQKIPIKTPADLCKDDDSLHEYEQNKVLRSLEDESIMLPKQNSVAYVVNSSESLKEDDSLQEFENRKSLNLIGKDTNIKLLEGSNKIITSDSSGREDDSLMEFERQKLLLDTCSNKNGNKPDRIKAPLMKSLSTDSSEKDEAFSNKNKSSINTIPRKKRRKSIKKNGSVNNEDHVSEALGENNSCSKLDGLRNDRDSASTSDLDRLKSTSDLESIGDKYKTNDDEEHSADFDTAEDSAYDKSEMSVLESLHQSITEMRNGIAAIEETILSESSAEVLSAKSSLSLIESIVDPINKIQKELVQVEQLTKDNNTSQFSPCHLLDSIKEPLQELGRNLEIIKLDTNDTLLANNSQSLLDTVSQPLHNLQKELICIQQQAVIETGDETYSEILNSFKPSLLEVRGGIEQSESELYSKFDDFADISNIPQCTYAQANEHSDLRSLGEEQMTQVSSHFPTFVQDFEKSLTETKKLTNLPTESELCVELNRLVKLLEACKCTLYHKIQGTSNDESKDILISIASLVHPIEQLTITIGKSAKLFEINKSIDSHQSPNTILKSMLESNIYAVNNCVKIFDAVALSSTNNEMQGLGIKAFYKLYLPLEELKITMNLVENLSEQTTIELIMVPIEAINMATSDINLETAKSMFTDSISQIGVSTIQELDHSITNISNTLYMIKKLDVVISNDIKICTALYKPLLDLQRSLHIISNDIQLKKDYYISFNATDLHLKTEDICKSLKELKSQISSAHHDIELEESTYLLIANEPQQSKMSDIDQKPIYKSLHQLNKSVNESYEFLTYKLSNEAVYFKYLIFVLNELIQPLNDFNYVILESTKSLQSEMDQLPESSVVIGELKSSVKDILEVFPVIKELSENSLNRSDYHVICIMNSMEEPLLQIINMLSEPITKIHKDGHNIINEDMAAALEEPLKYLEKSLLNISQTLEASMLSKDIISELRPLFHDLRHNVLIACDKIPLAYSKEMRIQDKMMTLQSLSKQIKIFKTLLNDINATIQNYNTLTSLEEEVKCLHSIMKANHDMLAKLSSLMVQENYVKRHSLDRSSADIFPVFHNLLGILRDFEHSLKIIDLIATDEKGASFIIHDRLSETLNSLFCNLKEYQGQLILESNKAMKDPNNPVHYINKITKTLIESNSSNSQLLSNTILGDKSFFIICTNVAESLSTYCNYLSQIGDRSVLEVSTSDDTDVHLTDSAHDLSNDTIKDARGIIDEISRIRVSLQSVNVGINIVDSNKFATLCKSLKNIEEILIENVTNNAFSTNISEEKNRNLLKEAFCSLNVHLGELEKYYMDNYLVHESISQLRRSIKVTLEHINFSDKLSEVYIIQNVMNPLNLFKDRVINLTTSDIIPHNSVVSYLDLFEKSASDLELGLMKLEHALLNTTGDFSNFKNVDIDVIAHPIAELVSYTENIEDIVLQLQLSRNILENSDLSILRTLSLPVREIQEGVIEIQEQIILDGDKSNSKRSCPAILYDIAKPIRELRSGVALIQEQVAIMKASGEAMSEDVKEFTLQALVTPINELHKMLSSTDKEENPNVGCDLAHSSITVHRNIPSLSQLPNKSKPVEKSEKSVDVELSVKKNEVGTSKLLYKQEPNFQQELSSLHPLAVSVNNLIDALACVNEQSPLILEPDLTSTSENKLLLVTAATALQELKSALATIDINKILESTDERIPMKENLKALEKPVHEVQHKLANIENQLYFECIEERLSNKDNITSLEKIVQPLKEISGVIAIIMEHQTIQKVNDDDSEISELSTLANITDVSLQTDVLQVEDVVITEQDVPFETIDVTPKKLKTSKGSVTRTQEGDNMESIYLKHASEKSHQEHSQQISESTEISSLKTLAVPINELKEVLACVNEQQAWILEPDVTSLSENTLLLGTIATPLQELRSALATIDINQMLEGTVEDHPMKDNLNSLAKPVYELQHHFAKVENQLSLECMGEDLSNQENITLLKKIAKPINEISGAIAVIMEHQSMEHIKSNDDSIISEELSTLANITDVSLQTDVLKVEDVVIMEDVPIEKIDVTPKKVKSFKDSVRKTQVEDNKESISLKHVSENSQQNDEETISIKHASTKSQQEHDVSTEKVEGAPKKIKPSNVSVTTAQEKDNKETISIKHASEKSNQEHSQQLSESTEILSLKTLAVPINELKEVLACVNEQQALILEPDVTSLSENTLSLGTIATPLQELRSVVATIDINQMLEGTVEDHPMKDNLNSLAKPVYELQHHFAKVENQLSLECMGEDLSNQENITLLKKIAKPINEISGAIAVIIEHQSMEHIKSNNDSIISEELSTLANITDVSLQTDVLKVEDVVIMEDVPIEKIDVTPKKVKTSKDSVTKTQVEDNKECISLKHVSESSQQNDEETVSIKHASTKSQPEQDVSTEKVDGAPKKIKPSNVSVTTAQKKDNKETISIKHASEKSNQEHSQQLSESTELLSLKTLAVPINELKEVLACVNEQQALILEPDVTSLSENTLLLGTIATPLQELRSALATIDINQMLEGSVEDLPMKDNLNYLAKPVYELQHHFAKVENQLSLECMGEDLSNQENITLLKKIAKPINEISGAIAVIIEHQSMEHIKSNDDSIISEELSTLANITDVSLQTDVLKVEDVVIMEDVPIEKIDVTPKKVKTSKDSVTRTQVEDNKESISLKHVSESSQQNDEETVSIKHASTKSQPEHDVSTEKVDGAPKKIKPSNVSVTTAQEKDNKETISIKHAYEKSNQEHSQQLSESTEILSLKTLAVPINELKEVLACVNEQQALILEADVTSLSENTLLLGTIATPLQELRSALATIDINQMLEGTVEDLPMKDNLISLAKPVYELQHHFAKVENQLSLECMGEDLSNQENITLLKKIAKPINEISGAIAVIIEHQTMEHIMSNDDSIISEELSTLANITDVSLQSDVLKVEDIVIMEDVPIGKIDVTPIKVKISKDSVTKTQEEDNKESVSLKHVSENSQQNDEETILIKHDSIRGRQEQDVSLEKGNDCTPNKRKLSIVSVTTAQEKDNKETISIKHASEKSHQEHSQQISESTEISSLRTLAVPINELKEVLACVSEQQALILEPDVTSLSENTILLGTIATPLQELRSALATIDINQMLEGTVEDLPMKDNLISLAKPVYELQHHFAKVENQLSLECMGEDLSNQENITLLKKIAKPINEISGAIAVIIEHQTMEHIMSNEDSIISEELSTLANITDVSLQSDVLKVEDVVIIEDVPIGKIDVTPIIVKISKDSVTKTQEEDNKESVSLKHVSENSQQNDEETILIKHDSIRGRQEQDVSLEKGNDGTPNKRKLSIVSVTTSQEKDNKETISIKHASEKSHQEHSQQISESTEISSLRTLAVPINELKEVLACVSEQQALILEPDVTSLSENTILLGTIATPIQELRSALATIDINQMLEGTVEDLPMKDNLISLAKPVYELQHHFAKVENQLSLECMGEDLSNQEKITLLKKIAKPINEISGAIAVIIEHQTMEHIMSNDDSIISEELSTLANITDVSLQSDVLKVEDVVIMEQDVTIENMDVTPKTVKTSKDSVTRTQEEDNKESISLKHVSENSQQIDEDSISIKHAFTKSQQEQDVTTEKVDGAPKKNKPSNVPVTTAQEKDNKETISIKHASEKSNQEHSQQLSESTELLSLKTLAVPINELKEVLACVNEQQALIIEPDVTSLSENTLLLGTIATPLQELRSALATIDINQMLEGPVEDLPMKDHLNSLAKPVYELQHHFAKVENQLSLECMGEDLSNQENITLLKKIAKPINEISGAIAVIIENQTMEHIKSNDDSIISEELSTLANITDVSLQTDVLKVEDIVIMEDVPIGKIDVTPKKVKTSKDSITRTQEEDNKESVSIKHAFIKSQQEQDVTIERVDSTPKKTKPSNVFVTRALEKDNKETISIKNSSEKSHQEHSQQLSESREISSLKKLNSESNMISPHQESCFSAEINSPLEDKGNLKSILTEEIMGSQDEKWALIEETRKTPQSTAAIQDLKVKSEKDANIRKSKKIRKNKQSVNSEETSSNLHLVENMSQRIPQKKEEGFSILASTKEFSHPLKDMISKVNYTDIEESTTSDYSSASYSDSFKIRKSQSCDVRQRISTSNKLSYNTENVSATNYNSTPKDHRHSSKINRTLSSTRHLSPSKPMFCGKLVDRTASKGSRLKVTCSLVGNPEPTVQWYKNGNAIPTSDHERINTVLSNGLASLEITTANLGDCGKYTCVARNCHGETSTTSNIKIFSYFESAPEAPVFTKSVTDQYKSTSDELLIECRVKGYPQPTVTWYKDNQPLPVKSRYQQSLLTDGTCRLVIHGPEPSDSALYKCEAINAVWSEQTSAFVLFEGREKYLNESSKLKDTRLPRFTNIMSDHVVREGGTVALQVAVKGTPRADITWYRDSQLLPKNSSRYRYLEDSCAGIYSLVMLEASKKEAGTYTCRASNAYGSRDTSLNVDIVGHSIGGATVRGKPAMFLSRPDTTMSIAVGEDITVSFRVSGDPKPQVTWMKKMRDITNDMRNLKETVNDYVQLSLKRATIMDAGTYFITAKNIYGADHAFVTVKVRQRARSLTPTRNIWSSPDVPTVLRDIHESTKALIKDVPGPVGCEPKITDSGKNWLSLTWDKPEVRGAAPVLAYRVEAWLLGSETSARWTELGVTPINSFDAFFLKPGADYKFRITARNRYGWGESVTSTDSLKIGSINNSPPEIIRDLSGPLKVLQNDVVTLECEICGDPSPNIQWLRDGHDVSTIPELEGRVFVSDNPPIYRLVLKELNEDDSGRFVCEATNKHGRASTYTRLFVVSDPRLLEADRKLKENITENQELAPQLTMRLRDRRVQASYPVRLTCQIVGNPAPTISWSHQGKPITQDDQHQIVEEADHFYTLEISRSVVEDNGQYTVQAQNCLGAVSCHCELTVDKGIRAYIAPVFISELTPSIKIMEGSELRVFAQVEAYPTVGITWLRNGVRLRPSRRLVVTVDPEGRIELALANVTDRDAGLYCCTASNIVGRSETSCQVIVDKRSSSPVATIPKTIITSDIPYSKEPRFIIKPRSTDAVEGETVVITCEVTGDPQPEVMWLRDWLKPGYYRDAAQFCQVTGNSPGQTQYSLEIPQVKLDFTGTYCVIAKNTHGEAKAIISLQIFAKGQGKESSMVSGQIRHGKVESLPAIKRELRDIRCCDGDSATLECEVLATPQPSVRWEKDGKLLSLGEDIECVEEGELARLTIKKVYPEDEGQYSCVAYNQLGRAVTTACLIVDVPEEKDTLINQRLKRPSCLLSAHSTPHSTPRNTPSPSRSLSPSPLPSRYREFTSPSFSRPKRIKMSSPKFYTVPHNRIAEEGETIRFQCSVAGHPTPWASWDKDGHIVTPSSRLTVTERDDIRTLELREVTVEDAGLYRVTLENEMGSVESSARLDVIGHHGKGTRTVRAWSAMRASPTFGRRLVGSAARVGGTFTLSCDVRASPSPITSWYRNGELLVLSERAVPSWDGQRARLELRDIQPDDAGVYTCVAENVVGTTQCSAELRVLTHTDPSDAYLQPPVFVKGLQSEMTVAEGQPYELQTTIQGSSPLEVVWAKDGMEVPDCEDFRYVEYGDGRYGLRIADVFVADAGIYNCEAFNDHGDAITSGHLIVSEMSEASELVKEPDQDICFTKTPCPVLAPLRGQASFCARLQTIPHSHTTFTWTVSGHTVTSADDRFLIKNVDDCSILKISEVRASDVGDVTCTARVCSPGVASTTVSCGTRLDLDCTSVPSGSPAALMRGPSDATVMRGDRVLLKATYRGNPEPSVQWLKAGRELQTEGRFQITSRDGVSCLTISAITADDSGKYVVNVENIHGAECHFASVAVEGPPEPPSARPSVAAGPSPGTAVLAWSSPAYDGGCVLTGYMLEMRTMDNPQWSVVTDRCHFLSHVVQGLVPGDTYVFRVRAENIHGASESSAESFPFTLESEISESKLEEADDMVNNTAVSLEAGEYFMKRYSIHEELGKGRYGVVHKVTDQHTGSTMAAKFVRCIKKQDREKVQEEIDIMNCLRHPKLLQLTAAFENPKDIVMVMEYISGGELFERVVADDFTLTERDCIIFLRQICEGVSYMHKNQVVHLDLKPHIDITYRPLHPYADIGTRSITGDNRIAPVAGLNIAQVVERYTTMANGPENIMCHTRTSHKIKIIDFGLAQKLQTNTPVRVLFGTPEFIPPEIINYEPIGVETDMWSVGVICYVLLSGLSPFMGDNDAETFANITRADYDFDDEAFDAISQDAKDFISSLLVKRKEKRLTADECFKHKWFTQGDMTVSCVKLSTDKLKKFIIRRKWQPRYDKRQIA